MTAFDGLRMLDLARIGPGPYCSMLLGDMGVDVLRIEPPHDERRHTPAAGEAGDDDVVARARGQANDAIGRNKRSMVLNLREAAGRAIVHRLAETADVFLEGFRPGVVDRLEVGYERIAAINPRIVYCSISGYGQDGPYRDLVGHDINYIAMAGMLGIVGRPGQRPAIPSNIVGDYAGGGLMAAFAIASALYARERNGDGQYIDLAMSDGVMYLLAKYAQVLIGEPAPKPGRERNSGLFPHYEVYECADGKWLALGSLEPHFWANLCRAVGREDFVELLPELLSDSDAFPEVREHFERTFRQKTRDEWFAELRSIELCVAPVYALDEAFADPHNAGRMVVEIDDPVAGPVPTLGIGPKLSGTPGSIRRPAPRLGEHGDEVLAELGYDADAIAELRARGVLG